ncbi:MAG TPA: hypothetical protein VGK30_00915 [Candidatus Binatia bacterium]|jgi:hypothetical protein
MSRHAFVGISLLAFAVVLPGRAAWSKTPVTECGQFFHGKGVLVADLDCSGYDGHAVLMSSGKLDLAGFTITQGHGYAVGCSGNCRVIGPGKLIGNPIGFEVVRAESVSVRNVTITGGNGGVNATNNAKTGRAAVRDSTITGSQFGIVADRLVKVIRSTVTDNGRDGVSSGNFQCDPGKVFAVDSTITGNGTDPLCGIDFTCADVASCKHEPILRRSVCDTSYKLDSGIPGNTLGVCSLD